MKDLLEKIVSYLPVYIPDLIRLVSSPKSFVAERNTGSEGDLTRPFTFLGVSRGISFILQAGVPAKNFFYRLCSPRNSVSFFVVVFSAILRLSWKIVGGKAEYKSYLTTSSYYFGAVWIGFAAGALCFVNILRMLYIPSLTHSSSSSLPHRVSGAHMTPSFRGAFSFRLSDSYPWPSQRLCG